MKNTKRVNDSQKIGWTAESGCFAECTNCQTTEYLSADEARGDYDMEQVPCHDDDCAKMLCPSCDQFQCDACDNTFCAEHRVFYSGLELCGACMREALEDIAQDEAQPKHTWEMSPYSHEGLVN